jgi:hypothetical protein
MRVPPFRGRASLALRADWEIASYLSISPMTTSRGPFSPEKPGVFEADAPFMHLGQKIDLKNTAFLTFDAP